jgi:methionyl-tRNA formyltransferase
MNVLVLTGRRSSPLTPIIEDSGCAVKEFAEKIDVQFLRRNRIDFAVSYGYRHIIKKPIIAHLKGKIINLHISYLPWNRGVDPNLWSFLENTPKGVSIHYIDAGIDTGDIIAQKQITGFDADDTLASSYQRLSAEMMSLFKVTWPNIIKGTIEPKRQIAGGTFHKFVDKKPFEYLLKEKGYDTPVCELIGKAIGYYPKREIK